MMLDHVQYDCMRSSDVLYILSNVGPILPPKRCQGEG